MAEPDHLSLRKGLLWQQKDKLFSRWKERYFILSRDLLQVFRKAASKITECGEFIFSIKLCEVEAMELVDRRGYLTICLSVPREGKVFLRKTEGIRDWYQAVQETMLESKARRSCRTSAVFGDRRQKTDSSVMEHWVAQKLIHAFSDSMPEVNKGERERITLDELSKLYRNEELEEGERQEDCQAEVELGLEKLLLLGCDSDSGNNSLQSSSTGTASSVISQPPGETSFVEEDEEDYLEDRLSPEVRIKRMAPNTNVIEVRYRGELGGSVGNYF